MKVKAGFFQVKSCRSPLMVENIGLVSKPKNRDKNVLLVISTSPMKNS